MKTDIMRHSPILNVVSNPQGNLLPDELASVFMTNSLAMLQRIGVVAACTYIHTNTHILYTIHMLWAYCGHILDAGSAHTCIRSALACGLQGSIVDGQIILQLLKV